MSKKKWTKVGIVNPICFGILAFDTAVKNKVIVKAAPACSKKTKDIFRFSDTGYKATLFQHYGFQMESIRN